MEPHEKTRCSATVVAADEGVGGISAPLQQPANQQMLHTLQGQPLSGAAAALTAGSAAQLPTQLLAPAGSPAAVHGVYSALLQPVLPAHQPPLDQRMPICSQHHVAPVSGGAEPMQVEHPGSLRPPRTLSSSAPVGESGMEQPHDMADESKNVESRTETPTSTPDPDMMQSSSAPGTDHTGELQEERPTSAAWNERPTRNPRRAATSKRQRQDDGDEAFDYGWKPEPRRQRGPRPLRDAVSLLARCHAAHRAMLGLGGQWNLMRPQSTIMCLA